MRVSRSEEKVTSARKLILAREVLFDLDGTLLDSIPAVELAWSMWAKEVGINPETLPNFHGRPSRETLSTLVSRDELEHAVLRIQELETVAGANVQAKPGAISLLSALPSSRWAIVTSGHRDVSLARIASAGLPLPPRMVSGDDVVLGKPDPEPFLKGQSLPITQGTVVVAVEDTVAGMESARAAGCVVIGVAGTHHVQHIAEYCDIAIKSLEEISVGADSENGVELKL